MFMCLPTDIQHRCRLSWKSAGAWVWPPLAYTFTNMDLITKWPIHASVVFRDVYWFPRNLTHGTSQETQTQYCCVSRVHSCFSVSCRLPSYETQTGEKWNMIMQFSLNQDTLVENKTSHDTVNLSYMWTTSCLVSLYSWHTLYVYPCLTGSHLTTYKRQYDMEQKCTK